MYRMALMAMTLPEDIEFIADPCVKVKFDKIKCMEMALVHDLAESIVGDITPNCGVSVQDKHEREAAAMIKIHDLLAHSNSLAASRIQELFNEYELHHTTESRIVHDLDKFEMVLQAQEYEQKHSIKLDSFFMSTRNIYQTRLVHDWDQQIVAKRK